MAGAIARIVAALVGKATQYFHASIISAYLLWRWARTGGAALKAKEHKMPRKLVEDYNHKFISLPSGVNMHYVEAGDSSAPLMVLVHGFPEFWYSWRFQIDHFKDRYRVVVIDQRGYGETSKPPNITDYITTLLAKDVDDLIHGLDSSTNLSSSGYTSAVVIGHDWGGAVAWTHALLYPQSVARLIVCNCPHPAAFNTLLKKSSELVGIQLYMFFYQTPKIPEAAVAADDFEVFLKAGIRNRENFTSEYLEAWKYTFNTLRSAINYYRCAFQYPSNESIPMKCRVKTLIIWGDQDHFLIKEGATLSTQWCDDAILHFIPGSSHWVPQDNPRLVNDHIDNFL
ncbi:hypothetical protein PMAYCL1PPCAC_15405, partial [Pristionchus mayeri]